MSHWKYKEDFKFEKNVSFKTTDWTLYKGPVLPLGTSEIKIKIIKCKLIGIQCNRDVIYFDIGVCTLDFNDDCIAWCDNAWGFGSGLEYGIYQHSDQDIIGQLIEINDEITFKVDLRVGEMSLKINNNDYGVVFTKINPDVCFAISTRGDLDVEFMFRQLYNISDLRKLKKGTDISFYFQ